jgi:hypothetical protein
MKRAINLTGGTFKHRSLPVSAQVTKNLFPQLIDNQIVKDKYILTNFVGQSLFGSVSGTGRGMVEYNDLLHRVCGNKLYSVDSLGVHTLIGNVQGGEKCIFDKLGNDLIIIADRKAFIYNGTTITQVTDIDLQSPDSVAVLNNQAIYDGNNDQFGVSDVGDASSINGLNYATAESKADNLIRVYVFDQIVYMFGEKTVEQWWNSGVGRPPFDRVQGGTIEKGLAGLHGVTNTDDLIYFFADDRELYQLNRSSKTSVTPTALITEFQTYSTVSDVIVWNMKLMGGNFIVLTFPTANRTWVYIEGGDWFQWSTGTKDFRNKANSYINIYNKDLVEDCENGNIYQLSFDTHTDNNEVIIRQRDTALIDGESFGFPDQFITMNKFVLNMESGVGLLSGQGSTPEVMLSFSDDGGRTFGTELRGNIGVQGAFNYRVEWGALGRFYSRIFRIKISDPVSFTIKTSYAEFEINT